MKIMLDEGAYAPIRSHATDAGMDIRTPVDFCVSAGSGATIRTGVHVELPSGTCGILVSKSGLNTLKSVTSTGLIDEGYSGEIVVKLYNHGTEHVNFRAGDKISQLVVVPVLYEDIEIVDRISGGERGTSGFGSTGR